MTLNRRQALRVAGAAALGARLLPGRVRAALEGKRVLFFTKSSGFEHSVIKRDGDRLSHAEGILTTLGKEHGFEVTCSKDGTLFEPDKIGRWDVFAFQTTGDLTTPGTDKQPPMSEAGKAAFLDAIKGGKGFVGFHCATDTFNTRPGVDPYTAMIGAQFAGHGAQQKVKLDVPDLTFPGTKDLTGTFTLEDEWYAQKNWADDLHVIIAHDSATMTGKDYETRNNYPETWARVHGKGRVFYSSMGHREDVWANPLFQKLALGGLLWASGLANAEVDNNTQIVTPYYKDEKKK